MRKRDFNQWLDTMIESINGYDYYVDFPTVYKNVEEVKYEAALLNVLIGTESPKEEFRKLIKNYPNVLNVVPNRGGHQMENLVEKYIRKTGAEYHKEMYLPDVERTYSVNLSRLSGEGTSTKRFDYVVKANNGLIYLIETNFYTGGGSKLNETSRSYKMLTEEAAPLTDIRFMWITDGKKGWKSARRNLQETFDVLEHLYNIHDLRNGIFDKLFK